MKKNYTAYLFAALYILVTVATLRHSAAGFASLEGGSIAWGYLSALAVDAGMILSAVGLQKRRTFWLVIGLLLSMAASTFTQVLYSVSHAAVMDVAAGAQWLGSAAHYIANVRVVILPALLPALSIVYSFASKTVGVGNAEQERDEARELAARLQHDVERLQHDVDNLRKAAPLIDALPMQTRARLFAMADGNGVTPREVADALDISISAARRGVMEVTQ